MLLSEEAGVRVVFAPEPRIIASGGLSIDDYRRLPGAVLPDVPAVLLPVVRPRRRVVDLWLRRARPTKARSRLVNPLDVTPIARRDVIRGLFDASIPKARVGRVSLLLSPQFRFRMKFQYGRSPEPHHRSIVVQPMSMFLPLLVESEHGIETS